MTDQIARTAHEVNRAYCISLGDLSQPEWKDAPEWQKSSARNGVQFHIDNPEALPSDSHENWLKQKVSEGWIWGEIKDAEKKTHPCCIPYDQLPESQKTKDALFIAVVHSFFYSKAY